MFIRIPISFVILSFLWLDCFSNAFKLKIINGSPVKITDVPFMALYRPKGRGELPYHCGAVIVHERFLISAAHCYIPQIPLYRVTVGTDNALQGGEDYDIEETIIHPMYEVEDKNNDVLVIKLKEKLNYSDRVRPIKMAPPDLKIIEGDMLVTMGFGRTNPDDENSFSKQLLKVTVPYVDQSVCKKRFFTQLTSSMMCAGGSDKDSCKGDSGGPLTFQNMVVGLVSYGCKTCGIVGVPAVYTRISAERHFIDKVITLESALKENYANLTPFLLTDCY